MTVRALAARVALDGDHLTRLRRGSPTHRDNGAAGVRGERQAADLAYLARVRQRFHLRPVRDVLKDLGPFTTRDELFTRHGRALTGPLTVLADPVLSRWALAGDVTPLASTPG